MWTYSKQSIQPLIINDPKKVVNHKAIWVLICKPEVREGCSQGYLSLL